MYTSEVEKDLLWDNPNPNNNFNDQIITLSDSVTNYSYISILVLFENSKQTTWSSIMRVDDFMKSTTSGGNNPIFAICCHPGTYLVRKVYYVSDTTLEITEGQQILGNGITNNYAIPQKIYGIK